ncbi:MAG: hypothetical protein E6H66_12505 [Betaproteobacteria bacterium]|nr:MAG: hypothetical protein E6H66_12505 [Betaproteobacteria bacterium]
MKQLQLAMSAAALAFGASVALADNSLYSGMDVKPLTAEQSAQMKAERDAAKAKWATMTPAEKTAATQSARSKKLADLNSMELLGANDDLTAMTKGQTAEAKAQHDAAKAKWEAMTPEQKTAARKAMRQKRLADLNEAEKYGAGNDIEQWRNQ